MISRFNLKLLTRLNRSLIINQAKLSLFFPRRYGTLIASDRVKHNLKPGYNFKKYSTTLQEESDTVEEEDTPEEDTTPYGWRYYVNYMEKNPDYHNTYFNIDLVREETKKSNRELFLAMQDFFRDESTMNEEKVIEFKEKLIAERAWLNYYELAEMVYNVLESEILRTNFNNHFSEMLKVLDWDCFNRFNENTVDQNLVLGQIWLKSKELKLEGVSDIFLHKLKTKYGYKIKSMSRTQLVVLFYIISKSRFPYIENPFFMWQFLQEMMEYLTIDEMALISRTLYFSRKNGFTQNSCVHVLDKLCDELKNCNETVARDALKGVNYCLSYSSLQVTVKKFQQSVAESADKFSVVFLNNALTLGRGRNSCNKDLVNITFNRLKNEGHSVKICHRFFNILSAYNINHPEFFELLQNRLRKEFDENPVHSVFALQNLALFEVYPEDLIARLLAPEFYEKLKKTGVELARKFVAFVDVSLDIEKPDYNGPRMHEKRRSKLITAMIFSTFNCVKFENAKHAYALEDSLKALGDSDQVGWKTVLPHFGRANIIIKLDENLKFQQLPDIYFDKRGNCVVKAPDDGTYLAFRIVKRQSMAYGDELNATETCFNRHLIKTGYVPVTIQLREWVQTKNDESLRLKLLEDKIKEAVENIKKIN